jgi:hypothetical protein
VVVAAIFSFNILDPYRNFWESLTLTDEIALLKQIKNKPPNNSHRQLVETIGVPKFTIVQVIQQQDKVRDGHYAIDNKDLAKNRNVKVKIRI